jgi:hypothetical protein
MIHLDCPCCAAALQLPDHWADSVVRCPECEERLRVPAPGLRPSQAHAMSAKPVESGGRFASGIAVALAAVPVLGVVLLFGRGGAGGPDAQLGGSVLTNSLSTISAVVEEPPGMRQAATGLPTEVEAAASVASLEH